METLKVNKDRETEKNKILCIVQLPPPVHGASIMNDNLVNGEIINKFFELIIVNQQFLKSIDKISKFSFEKLFKAFYYAYEIIKKIVTRKPDLVYMTFAPKGFALYRDLGYSFIVKMLGKNIVFHLHEKGIKASSKNSSLRKILLRTAFKNESIICLSEKLVNEIEDVFVKTPYIVPNGIKCYKPLKKKTDPSLNNIAQILFLSNYMLNKGILNLLDALEILKKEGYEYNARLVGGPVDLSIDVLQNLINEKKLSGCVIATGPLFHDEKIIELQNADIFVLPSKNEAFPLVILEAMQFGLPVVSTIEGGITDMVIDGETGYLVHPEDTQKLAEKIGILLGNKKLRLKMGEKGTERFMKNYTLDRFETNMTDTFYKILKK